MKKIVHVISLLRGLGGVQQAFISYYTYAQNHTKFKQYVYSTHKRSKKHGWFKNFFIIKKNFFSFLLHLYSKDSIIYFHNRLSSKKVFYVRGTYFIQNLLSVSSICTQTQFLNHSAKAREFLRNSLC